MDNIKFYEVSEEYVDYLSPYAPHLFRNRQVTQQNSRKYIGIVFHIGGMDYFAPLSSFKEKHSKMKESLDFIKVKNYAVINLNNMFPVPQGCFYYIDISKERNQKYKSLLMAEYRFIKSIQAKIRKNAASLYNLKIKGKVSALTKRCNDFLLLEELCRKYRN
ncbi:MAG: type III toxin-antitoxin system ToxN/AbiQ family toxin [Eubacterium sp.]|nr:type III toxin-antitoxin system ToxN/AbiQ family toxin [Eubacterium sp.]